LTIRRAEPVSPRPESEATGAWRCEVIAESHALAALKQEWPP